MLVTASVGYSRDGPFGYRAPLALSSHFSDGWVDLDMGRIHELWHLSNTSDVISALRTTTDRAITDITITTAEESDKAQAERANRPVPKPQPAKHGMDRPNKSEPREPVSAWDESRARARSHMYGQWGLKGRRAEEVVGFIPCTARPNDSPRYQCIADTDKMMPCVLDFHRISRIAMRVDVHGCYEWRFFHMTGQHPQQEEEIADVCVLGDETSWPTSQGQIRSILARLQLSDAYETYKSKMANTRIADSLRAHPRLITQQAATSSTSAALSDPDMVSGAITVHDSAMNLVPVALSEEARRQFIETADRVAMKNQTRNDAGPIANPCGGGSSAAAAASTKRKFRDGEDEYNITPGQVLAPGVHLAEAPNDLLPAKQAWMEAVSLAFGVPLAMLSSGDATGKAKLNAESAGPESSRIYLEAQKERRRSLSAQIAAIYSFMYSRQRVWSKITDKLTETKGKAMPSDDELKKESLAAASVIVRVAGAIEPDACMSLYERGIMRYPAVCDNLTRYYETAPDTWEERNLIAVEDLAGVAAPEPPEPAAAAASSKPKKKAKT